ncbi:MAG: type VI secretion system baseplate subunit TssF [Proteobacteria bacterium]|nr:type VI secretion system baseplate subunit TssF [Pseudomonadota bacterium]
MDRRSFREHLRFLYEGGHAMAQAHPRVAAMLGGLSYDPDVERLLEGIAFITSKIGERQAKSLDEVCQLLFDTLFPHYLAPLPATTILQFEQPEGAPRASVPRGSIVASLPVLETPCHFRTAFAVELGGLHLDEVIWQAQGPSTTLELRFGAGAWLAQPPARDRIALHLHGEPLLTRALYEWLLRAVERVELVDARGRPLALTALRPQALGFGEDEALLDYPSGSFPGFRLLQEYFTLPEKFLFVAFDGVWAELQRAGLAGGERFGLRLTLRASAESLVVTTQNLRLGCTPAANLFEHGADPVLRDPGHMDYRVRPGGRHLHHDTVRVLEVSGFSAARGHRPYALLSEADLSRNDGALCQLHRRLVGRELQSYLCVYDTAAELPTEETLTIELLCSNGYLPTALGVGDIRVPLGQAAELRCANLQPPTRPLPPPVGEDLRRRLVRHMALSQRELTSIAALREALTLYDFRLIYDLAARRAHTQLHEGLREATTTTLLHRHRGVPLWGQTTLLAVDDRAFTPGELHLLGSVLSELLALQAPLNMFSELGIRRLQTQDLHRWPKRLGREALASC